MSIKKTIILSITIQNSLFFIIKTQIKNCNPLLTVFFQTPSLKNCSSHNECGSLYTQRRWLFQMLIKQTCLVTKRFLAFSGFILWFFFFVRRAWSFVIFFFQSFIYNLQKRIYNKVGDDSTWNTFLIELVYQKNMKLKAQ